VSGIGGLTGSTGVAGAGRPHAGTCAQPGLDGAGTCGGEMDGVGYCGRCGVRAQPPDLPRTRPSTRKSDSRGRRSTPGTVVRRSSSSGQRGIVPLILEEGDDPREALLADPALPERKRACRNPKCYEGRTENGRPRMVEGFCRSCGWGYSFRPPLGPGMVVADRYEVLGAIGRGGLGWVYLAVDQRIGRYAVLKGLLNTDNPEHRRVASDELHALAGTDHPNIVAVHDTVRHRYRLPHPGGEVDIDYIVMDYLRGRSLLQLYRERRKRGEYLPVLEAGDSVLQALRALSYLHRLNPRGLLYNDFSPDNLMRNAAGRTWLIDFGGVSAIDDRESGGWGKDGYRDPYDNPPSPQTDLYAVGRTLALLTFHVPGFSDGKSLPGPDTEPLLARHESYHLLLRRATHPSPAHRFASADEMADQLEAVLREVRAAEEGRPCPGLSSVFGPEVKAVGAGPDGFPAAPTDRQAWALSLPDTLVDPADRYASRLGSAAVGGPRRLLQALDSLPDSSRETRVRAVRARLELIADRGTDAPPEATEPAGGPGRSAFDDLPGAWARGWRSHLAGREHEARRIFDEVSEALASPPATWAAAAPDDYATVSAELLQLAAEGPDVRVPWLRGIAALMVGAVEVARAEFDQVRQVLPGEAAPKLAAGLCAELLADSASAVRYYEAVWRTDRSYISAAFGLARARCARGEPAGAVEALSQVPLSSAHATAAALCGLVAGEPRAGLDEELAPAFFATAERLNEAHPDHLEIDDLRRQHTIVAVLGAAYGWLERGRCWPDDGSRPRPHHLLGLPLNERSLRVGMEAAYRRMAANVTVDLAQRTAYVDVANQVRNWSRW
jgi:serine/threonine-protein kinase PknG